MLSKRLAVALVVALAAVPRVLAEDAAADADAASDATAEPPATSQGAYEVSVSSIAVSDVGTNIDDVVALHNGREFAVTASLEWAEQVYDVDSSNSLAWKTYVDGVAKGSGSIDLAESRALPDTIDAGTAAVDGSGTHDVRVVVELDGVESEDERSYQSFGAGASFWPLVVVIFFASTTKMVELSLGMGVFTGACMVTGTIAAGFRSTLDVYILEALASVDHGYVFLFILFMAGLVGLIEKSGGLAGITAALRGFVKTSRTAQGSAFFAGVAIFFDDYANTLVAGASMMPLTDMCSVSREKLAFVVDATAAPIASIVPISSWVGFEISLIQAELEKIQSEFPDNDLAPSAFSVFVETIQYRYYCIFMLFFIPLLILSGRDFGPMLVAERVVRVYGRTDGGPGAALAADGNAIVSHNAPSEDTPCKWWNMVFPIIILVFYIFYLLVWTGQQAGDGTESFLELIELSDAYTALLWGTMAAALTALLFYFIQDKKDGRIIFFNVKGYINKAKRFSARCFRKRNRGGEGAEEAEGLVSSAEDEEEHARVLMSYREAMSAFLVGMEKIFGAMVVLTLAWATGAVMQAVGLNRFFGEILQNPALDPAMLPTITFVIAILIAFSTGTSWGTMTIMFPLVLVPAYKASGGDPVIFYGVTAGILAGAVAGDHASPISDTTILSSMASGCQVLEHVKTQAPYAVVVMIWSILVGTIPSGMKSFANWVSILLGFIFMLFHAIVTSEFAINKTGRYDIFTEIYLRCTKDKDFLIKLKEDTVKAYETGEPVPEKESFELIENDESNADDIEKNDTLDMEKQEQAVEQAVDMAVETGAPVQADEKEQVDAVVTVVEKAPDAKEDEALQ